MIIDCPTMRRLTGVPVCGKQTLSLEKVGHGAVLPLVTEHVSDDPLVDENTDR